METASATGAVASMMAGADAAQLEHTAMAGNAGGHAGLSSPSDIPEPSSLHAGATVRCILL